MRALICCDASSVLSDAVLVSTPWRRHLGRQFLLDVPETSIQNAVIAIIFDNLKAANQPLTLQVFLALQSLKIWLRCRHRATLWVE